MGRVPPPSWAGRSAEGRKVAWEGVDGTSHSGCHACGASGAPAMVEWMRKVEDGFAGGGFYAWPHAISEIGALFVRKF